MGFSLLSIFAFTTTVLALALLGDSLCKVTVFLLEREGSKALKRDLGLPPNVCGRPQGHRPSSNGDTRLLSDWLAHVYPS